MENDKLKSFIGREYKAQFWSVDIVFAIVIFTIAITILAYTWFNINQQLSLSYSNDGFIMQLQAAKLTNELFTPGFPTYWQNIDNTTKTNTWNGTSIGLVGTAGSADFISNKIYTLQGMSNDNYSLVQQFLGVSYNFYIIISTSSYNITIGENPITNGALTVYLNQRSALVDGTPAIVYVYLWSNQRSTVS
jgi:hypothetical protein